MIGSRAERTLMVLEHWNDTIIHLPGAHLLQTSEWAEIKRDVGWRATPKVWTDHTGKVIAAANILSRTIKPLGFGPSFSVSYIPRGPMLDWSNSELRNIVFNEIELYAKKSGTIFIKIDPEVVYGVGVPGTEMFAENEVGLRFQNELQGRGWNISTEQVQFKNTVLIDITGDEEDWLKRMKQKTRYNLRLAQRSGVSVRRAKPEEFEDLYRMYAQTADRDGFIIREKEYYLRVWNTFYESKMLTPLVAEAEGIIVSGLMLFHFGKRAWYLYGMSSNTHREKMPNYLLQWEAMRSAKDQGCEAYDLWGAPDVFDTSDSMFGVFRFKDGLGGKVSLTSGAWDFPIRPFYYYLYMRVIPKILEFTRRIRRSRIVQEAK